MRKVLAFIAAIVFSSALAANDAHLVQSNPADGSLNTTAPSAFVFEFSEPVRFHEAYLTKEGEKPKPVRGLPDKDTRTQTIPAPALSAGSYVLEWKVFTLESRVLSGRTHFTIAAPSS
jgi:methionine-rich copper-binding protein CopC